MATTTQTRLENASLSMFKINVPSNRFYFCEDCVVSVRKWCRSFGLVVTTEQVEKAVKVGYKKYVNLIN